MLINRLQFIVMNELKPKMIRRRRTKILEFYRFKKTEYHPSTFDIRYSIFCGSLFRSGSDRVSVQGSGFKGYNRLTWDF
jgi:hypothetical protein